jgi:DNA polymerase
MPMPDRVIEHIQKGGEIRAWNAQFERVIWREIMVKRYGAPEVQLRAVGVLRCRSCGHGAARALGQAADTLGVAQQKDDKGYRQMLQMSRPRKIEDDGTIVWWDVPAKLETLYAYCKQDVRTESSIVKSLRARSTCSTRR